MRKQPLNLTADPAIPATFQARPPKCATPPD